MNNILSNEFTSKPSEYNLDNKIFNKISYPFAPNMMIQKNGGSLMASNFFDVESELKNITRKLSKNPSDKHLPNENKEVRMLHFEDGGFIQENTKLTNPAYELKGVGINRWEPLFFDPQKNSIEPFNRTGDNTYLSSIDNYVNECKINK